MPPGLVVGAYAAGPILLGLVAPTALDSVGWRPSVAWLALGVAGLLAVAASVTPDHWPADGRSSRLDAARRDVVLLWIVFAGGTAPGLLLFAHAVTAAGDRRLSALAAGLAVSALAAGNLIGRLAAGVWSDRTGRLPALVVAFTTGAASMGAVAYDVVFTGWGCAGLLAPVIGGRLIGLSEQARALLGLAATPLIAAAVAVLVLARRKRAASRS